MRKGWIQLIKTLLLIAAAASMAAQESHAQKYSLEFKGGAAITSTFNNTSSDKSIMDFKAGPSIGAAFGYNFNNEMLRGYVECYYISKGEKYQMDSYEIQENDADNIFNSEVSYFQINPNIRFYTPYFPVYVGAGLYLGTTSSREVISGFNKMESHSRTNDEYYKKMDFGPRASFGTEIGVGSVRLVLEAAYEYGLTNICKISGKQIKNQSIVLSAGICFQIEGRHFRHY